MDNVFPKVKQRFGFGFMRLPMKNGRIDRDTTCRMVDDFMRAGFNYFDTAHGYLGEESEDAIRTCVAARYPRECFVLTNKLSNEYFKTEEEIRPFFERQLKACGVEYFDFYLMHAQTAAYFEKYKRCRAYETAFALKAEGKVRHVGISFHDNAQVLDRILTEYPQIEVVQIQLNYLDYDDAGIQGRQCYEVCKKHGKPVIVMEPVKGGNLVKLPKQADEVFRALGGGSNASYALRFAADFDRVFMVLSGMSTPEQLQENISFMYDVRPLSEEERAAIARVVAIFKKQHLIACTGCRYCVAGCPEHILIPDLFADANAKLAFGDWNSEWYYEIHTKNNGAAKDCIRCGKCEAICPQKLPVRKLLRDVSAMFDGGEGNG